MKLWQESNKKKTHDEIYEYQKSLKSVHDSNSAMNVTLPHNRSMSLLQQTLGGQPKRSINLAQSSRAVDESTKHQASRSKLLVEEPVPNNQERSKEDAEESLALQNIRFGSTFKSGNTGTGYNSSFASSTMNKTNFQPIQLKFSEKT